MKKMASMQVYMPVDAASRQALDRQMISWDENLERLHVEQYQLRCYLAALQGSADLPSTKVPQSLPRRYLSVVVAHFRNRTSLGAVAPVWPGGVMLRALDVRLKGRRFDFRPSRCQITTMGKLFTHLCLCHQAV